ncbi:hypothetical protein A3752_21865 [Oleiphilus sp. HI0081]|nr:hypothetical protein A3729_01795 [Oleiphilus sp. HI0043]KZY84711.1 hypothetical protein A3741_16005 [Oleiphilus sp. HI0069]KZZ19202.1 hypothetical protein A3749_03735 [Oleiphilus sp. HI0078]KZZ28099.1 hypothetical protein A3752_21865 [Oleiphilus sp. HI0081]KZZ47344.1 hypothetical protein A3755_15985 [Oleiphilus sp. HI0085]
MLTGGTKASGLNVCFRLRAKAGILQATESREFVSKSVPFFALNIKIRYNSNLHFHQMMNGINQYGYNK